MKPKQAVKICVDDVMTLGLLFLMGYHLWSDTAHEWVGAGLFVLFILHHILNWRWWAGIFKGKYTAARVLQTVVNLLTLAAMVGLMVSGVILSSKVFAFLPIRGHMAFARRLHMAASHWGFLLMTAHLGLHWGALLGMARKAGKTRLAGRPSPLPTILGALIAAYGGAAINDNRKNSHNMIDHIFQDLLPTRGMIERSEQVSLSHLMLDAMLDGSIALCDAGTGIGKTYSYLAAGVAFHRFRTASGQEFRPILISTSSIALQNAVQNEYLPLLSDVLMEDGLTDQPLRSVIRKGKSHYVCDQRLERRLGQLDLSKKNWKAGKALLSLREHLDVDTAAHLSSYDRERVCVPQTCDCGRENCRYLAFLEECSDGGIPFQICNHNLLLADAIHHGTGRTPILPDSCVIIIDEAHKLPETARQMFGTTLEAQDIRALIRSLRREKFLLAAETFAELSAPLLGMMTQPFEDSRPFKCFARLLIAPARNLHIIQKQLYGLLKPSTHSQLEKLSSTMALFNENRSDLVFYTMEYKRGGTMLCAVAADMTAQLRSTLWNRSSSVILTSGTLAVGTDFRRFKEETGLLADGRIIESVSPSPFAYNTNCLLYLPSHPPEQMSSGYFDELAAEIAALLDACWGHALVLFTSYAAMSAIKERLTEMNLPWEIFTLSRNAVHTTQQFKASLGSVLLATGAAWEGFDFPGDCVSLLVIPRLPFSHPDALKEKKRAEYPSLRAFIQAVVVPEMQIKLKQGFGRAIRTETDTCVVAILDERAVPGQRHFEAMQAALPEMQMTDSLENVVEFIYRVKGGDYFCHENASDV